MPPNQERRHEAESRNGKSAGEGAGHADPDAVDFRDRRDVGFGEAEIDVERVRHHARNEIGQAVKRHKRQDESEHPALAADEIGERLDEGCGKRRKGERAAPRARGVVGGRCLLRCARREKASRDADRHEGRHREVGGFPAYEIRKIERAGAGAEQGEPITELVGRRHHALAFARRRVDAPAVDHDILRRRHEGDEEGARHGPGERMGGIAEGEARKPERDAELGDEHPGTAAAEKPRKPGHVEGVDDRSPKKFQCVGEGDVAQKADLGARDADLAQPRRLRRKDEEERQARAEPECQHQRKAPIGEDIGEERRAFGRQAHASPCRELREVEHGAKLLSRETGRLAGGRSRGGLGISRRHGAALAISPSGMVLARVRGALASDPKRSRAIQDAGLPCALARGHQ